MGNCQFHEQLLPALASQDGNTLLMDHIQSCGECRQAWREYQQLLETLAEMLRKEDPVGREEKIEILPLPENIKNLVTQRRVMHQRERLQRALGLQGITDPEEKKRAIKKILHTPPADLPLAAFPDDLHEDK